MSPGNKPDEITCTITKDTKVVIRAKTDDTDLFQPLYAVNWFNTRIEWMYHLYNTLAHGSVKNAGGKAIFKARVKERICGQDELERAFILLVRYPDGNSFKRLMEYPFFKAISILRMLSAKDFTFGFTKELVLDLNKKQGRNTYAMHHFRSGKQPEIWADELQKMIVDPDVILSYAGFISANIYVQKKSKGIMNVPCLMDGIIILKSTKAWRIRDFFESDSYVQFRNNMDTNFIALLDRIH